jgi:hypothetical protein
VAELRLQEATLFREEQEALLAVLTPVQLLRLQDLRQELGQRIRALRGGRDGDFDRRRGPAPGGPGAFRMRPGAQPPGTPFLPREGEPRGSARVL